MKIKIRLYEDNAGGLVLSAPDGTMSRREHEDAGEFRVDAIAAVEGWGDLDGDCGVVVDPQGAVVAEWTYCHVQGRLALAPMTHSPGVAARRYIGAGEGADASDTCLISSVALDAIELMVSGSYERHEAIEAAYLLAVVDTADDIDSVDDIGDELGDAIRRIVDSCIIG